MFGIEEVVNFISKNLDRFSVYLLNCSCVSSRNSVVDGIFSSVIGSDSIDHEQDPNISFFNEKITVADAREVKNSCSLSNANGQYKFCVIYNIDQVSDNVYNALLKILEDSGRGHIFLLFCNNIDDVPLTVKSRSVELKVKHEVYSFSDSDYDSYVEFFGLLDKISIRSLADKFLLSGNDYLYKSFLISISQGGVESTIFNTKFSNDKLELIVLFSQFIVNCSMSRLLGIDNESSLSNEERSAVSKISSASTVDSLYEKMKYINYLYSRLHKLHLNADSFALNVLNILNT